MQGGVVILLVTSCWVSCDAPASHPEGSSITPSHFMLGILWWTSIPSRGSGDTSCHLMLGILWSTSIPSRGSSATPSHFMLGILWSTSIPSSNTPSHFMLGILRLTSIPLRGSSDNPGHFLLSILWQTSHPKPEISGWVNSASLKKLELCFVEKRKKSFAKYVAAGKVCDTVEPSNMDTKGTCQSVCIIQVSVLSGLSQKTLRTHVLSITLIYRSHTLLFLKHDWQNQSPISISLRGWCKAKDFKELEARSYNEWLQQKTKKVKLWCRHNRQKTTLQGQTPGRKTDGSNMSCHFATVF